MKLYRLIFNSPLHISDVRADYGNSLRRLHSDTMYAAIIQAWAVLGKNEWISNSINFTLSSLFPFTSTHNDFVYFFPKPLTNPLQPIDEKEYKKIKKINYVDQHYFEKIINGDYQFEESAVKDEYLTNYPIELDFLTSSVMPRIRWHRNEKEDAEPFYMEKLFFKENSGMWFVFDGDDAERIKVEVALTYLQEAGLGTDRNVGNGTFKFEADEIKLRLPSDANRCINLSLFIPLSHNHLKPMLKNNDESIAQGIGYDLVRRGGWISEPFNSYRKRNIYMFVEGSVFHKDCNTLFAEGAIKDVRPLNTPRQITHPIYRVGKAIFFPIK